MRQARGDHLSGLFMFACTRLDSGPCPPYRFLMRHAFSRAEFGICGEAFPHVLFAGVESIAKDELEHRLRRAPGVARKALQTALLRSS
jgi:hypothetical protein